MAPAALALSEALGWLVALMLAALAPSLPALRGGRHAGWLVAFCATRLLVAAHGLVGPMWTTETRELAATVGGMLLWEFARRIWNESRPRRLPAATHVVALECVALIVAAKAAAGWAARPGSFLPLELFVATLPGWLGGLAALLLWRCFDRASLRLAAVGLGLYGLGAAAGPVATLGALAPWCVVGGLARVCFAVPATRTRTALVWLVGLLLTCAAGPLVIATNLRRIDAEQRSDLLARAQQAVAPLQGRIAAQLTTPTPLPADVRSRLREHLDKLLAADPLARDALVWKLHGNRFLVLDLTENNGAGFIERRDATAEELAHAVGLRPFVARDGERITVHGPLTAAPFETPVAWLALNYPQTFWAMQREHARRNGVALVAGLAGFCAMGFVLAGRQAIESAQRMEIERVQAADKAKTEFLAFLGHELRTPLQAILGRAEMLRALPAAARHATAIETQGQLLLRLVTDLLDLGTIEAGRLELRPQPFSLRALLAAIDDATRPLAEAAGLAFACHVDAAVPDALVGDEMRLRQILGNLLGNAVKYTSCGTVSLEVLPDAMDENTARIAFRVRDTGPGLPPKKISQLFTLFTRLDSGETFTREGTGVGLALVRRLCSLMGGTVTAANHPAGGAEFTVRLGLPLAATGTIPTSDTPVPVTPERLAVLVAEDNTATRELLAEALAALGHEVIAVADGEAALAAAEARAFDAVVLDINLPRRDGVAVARILRARSVAGEHVGSRSKFICDGSNQQLANKFAPTAGVPARGVLRIIGCSAEALPAMRETALAAGMDELLVKPVSLEALARAIAPASQSTPGENVFTRLRSGESSARIRALLRAEWPRLRAAAEEARAAGDADALKKFSHSLHSSALLLADETLLGLCRRLSAEAEPARSENARAVLAAFEHHMAAWPAETLPSSATTRPT